MTRVTTGHVINGQFHVGTFEEAMHHAGKQWTISHVFEGLADGGTIDVLIQTGSVQVKLHNSISALGNFHMHVFEDTVVAADGTPHTIVNLNRVTQAAIETVAFTAPTITETGTQISHEFIIGGAVGQGNQDNRSGSANEREVILKPNSNYLLRHVNASGGASSGTLLATISE